LVISCNKEEKVISLPLANEESINTCISKTKKNLLHVIICHDIKIIPDIFYTNT
jgi:hypothetical protein